MSHLLLVVKSIRNIQIDLYFGRCAIIKMATKCISEILNSYTKNDLIKEAKQVGVKKYSQLNKPKLIKLMLENKESLNI